MRSSPGLTSRQLPQLRGAVRQQSLYRSQPVGQLLNLGFESAYAVANSSGRSGSRLDRGGVARVADERAAPLGGGHQPLLSKHPDTVRGGHHRDVESIGQLTRGRQFLARLKLPGADLLPECVGYLDVGGAVVIGGDSHRASVSADTS